MADQSRLRIGVGGWIYKPWRGVFYPSDLTQKDELRFASRHLSSIEINGTYYGSQKPESFIKWHDETPDDFVFSVKGPRFTTNRRVLAEAGDSVARFFSSGVLELKDKLGPINWQLSPTKRFDPDDFAAFLGLLPRAIENRAIRHVVEVRHESFRDPKCIALAREHNVAICIAGDGEYVGIADVTADFVYVRLMGTTEAEPKGYSDAALDRWLARAKAWSAGESPDDDLPLIGEAARREPRDVFLYVISGYKERDPWAAMALIERLGRDK
jgi:uncharacterized protein YecE (DUF72 family)